MGLGSKVVDAEVAAAAALDGLSRALEQSMPGRTTHREFEGFLRRALGSGPQGTGPEPLLIYANDSAPFFANADMIESYRLFVEIEETSLRETVTALTALIQSRLRRRDPWLEGRLHLGIALAALEDWEAARDALQEVIDLCEGGDRAMQKNMAMAA